MSVTVLYGSRYGSTKKYAMELAKKLHTAYYSYEEDYPKEDQATVVYLGGLYAGGVLGLKRTLPQITDTYKRLIIVTVGLADPQNDENIRDISASLERQVSKETLHKCTVFHLRGGIDYGKLSFKHRTMMRLLYEKAKKLPARKQTPEVKAMIETYGGQVDFVDLGTLDKIIDAVAP